MLTGGSDATILTMDYEQVRRRARRSRPGTIARKRRVDPFDRDRDGFVLSEDGIWSSSSSTPAGEGQDLHAELTGFGPHQRRLPGSPPPLRRPRRRPGHPERLGGRPTRPDEIDYVNADCEHVPRRPGRDPGDQRGVRRARLSPGDQRHQGHDRPPLWRLAGPSN